MSEPIVGPIHKGGRVLNGGGGYIIGQENPRLHFQAPSETREEKKTNDALEAIYRVIQKLHELNQSGDINDNAVIELLGALNRPVEREV